MKNINKKISITTALSLVFILGVFGFSFKATLTASSQEDVYSEAIRKAEASVSLATQALVAAKAASDAVEVNRSVLAGRVVDTNNNVLSAEEQLSRARSRGEDAATLQVYQNQLDSARAELVRAKADLQVLDDLFTKYRAAQANLAAAKAALSLAIENSAKAAKATNTTDAGGTCVCKGEALYGRANKQINDALKDSCVLNGGVINGDNWCRVGSFSFPSKSEGCPSDSSVASDIFLKIIKTETFVPAGEVGGYQFRMSCQWSQTKEGPLAGTSVEGLKSDAFSRLNPARINNPTGLVNRAIQGLMAFIGSISLVLYIYSGFLWMTASGSSEQVGKAKSILVWTTLGVVVMLSSYMLASFLFKSLGL